MNEIIRTGATTKKRNDLLVDTHTAHQDRQSSDDCKQLILDLTLPFPRLGRHRRLALAHDALSSENGVRRRDVRLVVEPPFDVERHVDRRGGSQHTSERCRCHLVVVEAAPLGKGKWRGTVSRWEGNGGGEEEAHRVLETRKARVVTLVDLALVVDHCKKLVVVQRLWAGITARVGCHKHTRM